MKITKRIVTVVTEEVEACQRCEKREAKWLVGVSVHDMDGGITDSKLSPGSFCTACKDIVLGSLMLKRRPRKGKEAEPV